MLFFLPSTLHTHTHTTYTHVDWSDVTNAYFISTLVIS